MNKFNQTKKEIEDYLKISKSIITRGRCYVQEDEMGFYCNVYGDIIFDSHSIGRLFVRFKKIEGNLIYLNNLQTSPGTRIEILKINTLYGFPEIVTGDLIITGSYIRTLEYLPNYIGGHLSIARSGDLLSYYNESTIDKGLINCSQLRDLDDIEKRVNNFIPWLWNYSPDIQSSLNWLSKADVELFAVVRQRLLEDSSRSSQVQIYDLNMGMSEDVVQISDVTLNINHRL